MTTQELVSMLNDAAENFMEFSQTSNNTLHRDLYLNRSTLARAAADRLSEMHAAFHKIMAIDGAFYANDTAVLDDIYQIIETVLDDAASDKGEPKP